MKKGLFFGFILSLVILLSCQNIQQKITKDLKKTDSIVKITKDSLAALVKEAKEDTITQQEQQLIEEDENYYKQMLIGTYAALIKSIKSKDTIILRQFLYLPDSVLIVKSQGIFQILTLEPMSALFEYEYFSPPEQAWNCQLQFGQLPELESTGWSEEGCFAQKVSDIKDFSAIISMALDAGLSFPEELVNYAEQIQKKTLYKVINTYLGWTFYFIKENGKLYLAAVDFNQY